MSTTQASLRPSLSSPNIPFQISLNLVMKVQPIDEKYSMEPIGLRLNDVNILPPKTVRQQPFQQRQRSFSQQPLRGSINTNASDLEDSLRIL
uniref:Uncharacterized protein n=1 Tax=Panagrolaimus superbus TaxID=310955 RepID=A0A914Z8B2_9BILA